MRVELVLFHRARARRLGRCSRYANVHALTCRMPNFLVRVRIALLWLCAVGACGARHDPGSITRGGPPTFDDPAIARVRARFLLDQQRYWQDPEGPFRVADAAFCQVSPEFRDELLGVNFGKEPKGWELKEARLVLLQGTCAGDTFSGPVTYFARVVMSKDEYASEIERVVTTNLVGGKPDGETRTIVRLKMGDGWLTSLNYANYANGVAVGTAVGFGFKGPKDDYSTASATEYLAQGRSRWTMYMGPRKSSVQGYLRSESERAVQHGPAVVYDASGKIVSESCTDYGRKVRRTPCDIMAPPTPGIPSDALPGSQKTMAQVDKELAADVAAGASSLSSKQPKVPRPHATTPSSSESVRAQPPAGRAPATPRAQPSSQADALCEAAAMHQARLMAPHDESLREQLAGSVRGVCVKESWSNGRIGCVLSAATADEASECSKNGRPAPAGHAN